MHYHVCHYYGSYIILWLYVYSEHLTEGLKANKIFKNHTSNVLIRPISCYRV